MVSKITSKKNFKIGDRVYFITHNGIEYDTITDIDGQYITLSDNSYIHKKNCIDSNDPRIKNAKHSEPSYPSEEIINAEREYAVKKGWLPW